MTKSKDIPPISIQELTKVVINLLDVDVQPPPVDIPNIQIDNN